MRYSVTTSGTTIVSLAMALLTVASALAQSPDSTANENRDHSRAKLPDHYPYVAADILEYCNPRGGVWVDLGSGNGGVGLSVAKADRSAARQSTIVLLDPNAEALRQGLDRARDQALAGRVVAVVGRAEKMPLPSGSVDLVFSRGSIFFWDDPVEGLKEINRVLRPGGTAMIGGGLGSKYPEWARREFTRRRRGNQKNDSQKAKQFARLRDPKTFRHWADEAGLPDFEVIGQGALPPDDPRAGAGIWLIFTKGGGQ